MNRAIETKILNFDSDKKLEKDKFQALIDFINEGYEIYGVYKDVGQTAPNTIFILRREIIVTSEPVEVEKEEESEDIPF